MISLSAAMNLVIYLIAAGLIYWLLTWAVDAMGIPDPFNKIIKVIIILFAVLICLQALFSLFGTPLVRF